MEVVDIGMFIKDRLLKSPNVVSKIGNKVFALVAEENTNFPYVTYERTSFSRLTTKDGYCTGSEISVVIRVYSDKYEDSVSVANEIIKSLDGYSGNTHKINISHCRFVDSSEDFVDNSAYLQVLNFTIKTK